MAKGLKKKSRNERRRKEGRKNKIMEEELTERRTQE